MVPVKPSQVSVFYSHIGGFPGNVRNPQPLNDRTINYFVNKNADDMNTDQTLMTAVITTLAIVVFILLIALAMCSRRNQTQSYSPSAQSAIEINPVSSKF